MTSIIWLLLSLSLFTIGIRKILQKPPLFLPLFKQVKTIKDEFTSYDEQIFWKEVKGVDLIELKGGHICWFSLFNSQHEILRVLRFIESNL